MTTYTVLAVLSDARTVSTQVRVNDPLDLLRQLQTLGSDWQQNPFYTMRGQAPVVRLFAGCEDSALVEFNVDANGQLSNVKGGR